MTIGEFLTESGIEENVSRIQEINPKGCYVLTVKDRNAVRTVQAASVQVEAAFPDIRLMVITENMKLHEDKEILRKLCEALRDGE